MVIIFKSAIIGVLTLGAKHFCLKMYVHENVVRIFLGGGYKSLYTPRVYAPAQYLDANISKTV